MPDEAPRDPALEYFYFGFFRALRRFRAATVAGWCVAAAGFAAVALRWDPVWSGDLAGALLCGLLVGAGILIVQQGVSELSAYTRIPFPRPPADEESGERIVGAVAELSGIMNEVEEGGWQDAVQALSALRRVGERYDLPEPDGSPRRASGIEQTEH